MEELLQEVYDEACRLVNEAQNEIGKLSEATNLAAEPLEGKAKYAKSINDYMRTKDQAIARKIEIAKLLGEVIKHNGNMQEALENTMVTSAGSLDIDKLKEIASQAYGESQPPRKTYNINKVEAYDPAGDK